MAIAALSTTLRSSRASRSFCTQQSPRLARARAFLDFRQTLGVGVAAATVRWGVLGHGLVDFFAALGSRFGALLALLIQLVLGSQEFDEGLFGSVASLEAGADDAEIAAGAVSVTRGYRRSIGYVSVTVGTAIASCPPGGRR
jgi:hypothetical protein